jgi:hypothetical protein
VTNFPFKDPVSVRHIDIGDVERALRAFEDSWADATGERVSSAEFYDRYRAGLVDSMLAMRWAAYYEAFRRRTRDPVAETIASGFVVA